MSEKQFKLSSETVLQYQIMDNDTDLNESEVVDLLNKLYEENEQLHCQIIDLQDKQIRYSNANHKELTTKYLQLKEENEQLHYQIIDLQDKLCMSEKVIYDE